MKKRFLLIATLVVTTACGATDSFPRDFQSAMRLYQGGQFVRAEDAFAALSGRRVAQRGIDSSLAYAAYCASRQQEHDRATEYAGKIKDPHRRKLCQMHLLQSQRGWDAIIALSKDEDFESWPDDLIYPAFICRGDAWIRTGNPEAAVKDFRAAARHTVAKRTKSSAYLRIGNAYRDNIKDEQKALEAYANVVQIMSEPKPSMSGGHLVRASIARAELFVAQGNGEAALAELERLWELEHIDPYWNCAIQLCYGDTYEIMGKTSEAREHYRAATAVEGGSVDLIKAANQRMAALEETTPPNKESK